MKCLAYSFYLAYYYFYQCWSLLTDYLFHFQYIHTTHQHSFCKFLHLLIFLLCSSFSCFFSFYRLHLQLYCYQPGNLTIIATIKIAIIAKQIVIAIYFKRITTITVIVVSFFDFITSIVAFIVKRTATIASVVTFIAAFISVITAVIVIAVTTIVNIAIVVTATTITVASVITNSHLDFTQVYFIRTIKGQSGLLPKRLQLRLLIVSSIYPSSSFSCFSSHYFNQQSALFHTTSYTLTKHVSSNPACTNQCSLSWLCLILLEA